MQLSVAELKDIREMFLKACRYKMSVKEKMGEMEMYLTADFAAFANQYLIRMCVEMIEGIQTQCKQYCWKKIAK